jgi:hypothetical protein
LSGEGGQRLEDQTQTLDHFRLAADHHAVAFLQAPNSAAGTHVHKVQLLLSKLTGVALGVLVIRVAAVNDHVTWRKYFSQRMDGIVCDLT